MIISEIKDGFGNQLFMYACGYALSKQKGTKLILDSTILDTNNIRDYELGGLNIKYYLHLSIPQFLPYVFKRIIGKVIRLILSSVCKQKKETSTTKVNKEIYEINGNIRLIGYWQSEKYFKDYKDEIISMLTPNYKTSETFNKLKSNIKESESVSLHIRRGDFVALGWCLDKNYYKKAIDYVVLRTKKPTFYIFSDDINYAKEFLEDFNINKVYITYDAIKPTIEDFILMTNCKHNIIANSTYSWRGGYANSNPDKIVCCPPREARDFFYPQDWVVISF